jgi:hypothetical protein
MAQEIAVSLKKYAAYLCLGKITFDESSRLVNGLVSNNVGTF